MKLGIYRNIEDDSLYQVLGVSTHTETEEQTVVYVALSEKNNGLMNMPVEKFEELVDCDSQQVRRFEFVSVSC